MSAAGLVEVCGEMKEAASGEAKKCKPLEVGIDSKVPIECSICLDHIPNVRGTLACAHGFCYSCISQWSKSENSCPLCKARFTYILKENSSNNNKGKKVKIKKRSQSFEFGNGSDMPFFRRVMHQNPLDFLRMMFDPFAHIDMGGLDDDFDEDYIPSFLRYSSHDNRPIDLTGDNDPPRSSGQGSSGSSRSSSTSIFAPLRTIPRSPYSEPATYAAGHLNASSASATSGSKNREVIDLTKSSDDEKDAGANGDIPTYQPLAASSTSAESRSSGVGPRIAIPHSFATTNGNGNDIGSHSHSRMSGPFPAPGGGQFFFGSTTMNPRDFFGIPPGPGAFCRSVSAMGPGLHGGTGSGPSSGSNQSFFSRFVGDFNMDISMEMDTGMDPAGPGSEQFFPSSGRSWADIGSRGTRRRRANVRRPPVSASTGAEISAATPGSASGVCSASPPRSANSLFEVANNRSRSRVRCRPELSEAATDSPIANRRPVFKSKSASSAAPALIGDNITGNIRIVSSSDATTAAKDEANEFAPRHRRSAIKKPRKV